MSPRDDYFDLQWHFGLYSYSTMQNMIEAMLADESFAGDPERLWQLVLFLYQASETRPLDRAYHYHIGLTLEALRSSYEQIGDTEKMEKLNQALELYEGISATFHQEFQLSGLRASGSDPNSEPALLAIERACRRQENIIELILKLHLRLLKLVREALGFSSEDYPIITLEWEKE